MRRPLRVRDPVHGFIPYTDEEAALLETPVVQRLRGIKQLAFTYLVYPGATHTRFEHSLGVMHVAGRIAERVGIPPHTSEWRRVRLAALLHDIGHLPFSHAGETATLLLAPTEISGRGEEAHESIAVALIERDAEIHRVLPSEEDRLAVLDILEKGKKRRLARGPEPLLWQILSSRLDADKLDYLLRDSLMTGVKYGVFDLDRVVECFVGHGREGDRHLMVRAEDAPCVEQALLARYYMTEQVYRHRVRRITDAMLRAAIGSAALVEGELGEAIRAVFGCATDDRRWAPSFFRWDDASLLRDLAKESADTSCGEFGRRLSTRRLLKQVFDCRIEEIPYTGWRENLVMSPEAQSNLRDHCASALGVSMAAVLLDIRTKDNPLHRDPNISREEEISAVNDEGQDFRLPGLPGSLSAEARVREEARLYVYAEADDASPQRREEMAEMIQKVLETAAREGSR
jgi:HD superfamily phosphohydrolase